MAKAQAREGPRENQPIRYIKIFNEQRADSSVPCMDSSMCYPSSPSEGVLDSGSHQHQDLPDLPLPVGDIFGHSAPQLPMPGLCVLASLPHLLLLLLRDRPQGTSGRTPGLYPKPPLPPCRPGSSRSADNPSA